jgi:hypothetical protein
LEDIDTNTKDNKQVPQQWLTATMVGSCCNHFPRFGLHLCWVASTDGVILQDMSSSYNADNNGVWKSKATLIESTSQLVAVTIDDIAILLHNNHHCTNHVLLFDGHKVKKQTISGSTH